MATEIFKVQIPIFSTETKATALIYNKHRDVIYEQAITKQLLKLFKPDVYKIYMFGKVVKNDDKKGFTVELTSYAPAQDW